jgi:hypothetical protein
LWVGELALPFEPNEVGSGARGELFVARYKIVDHAAARAAGGGGGEESDNDDEHLQRLRAERDANLKAHSKRRSIRRGERSIRRSFSIR